MREVNSCTSAQSSSSLPFFLNHFFFNLQAAALCGMDYSLNVLNNAFKPSKWNWLWVLLTRSCSIHFSRKCLTTVALVRRGCPATACLINCTSMNVLCISDWTFYCTITRWKQWWQMLHCRFCMMHITQSSRPFGSTQTRHPSSNIAQSHKARARQRESIPLLLRWPLTSSPLCLTFRIKAQ